MIRYARDSSGKAHIASEQINDVLYEAECGMRLPEGEIMHASLDNIENVCPRCTVSRGNDE